MSKMFGRIPPPGLRDVLGLAGLLLVAAGLWRVWEPAALVVCGAILLYVALRRPPPVPEGLGPMRLSRGLEED